MFAAMLGGYLKVENKIFYIKNNMDGQVLGAIITGAAAIIAAIIAFIPKIFKRKPTQKDKLSVGFQFGYYGMELYYTIKFKYESEPILKDANYKKISEKLIAESKGKCQNLAKQL